MLGDGQGVDRELWVGVQYGEVPEAGGGEALPSGVILMWAGTVASVPTGYAFCNGQNGTPDLRDRYLSLVGGS